MTNSKQAGAILAIGAIMVDVVCRIPNLPARGEGVVVDQRDTVIGGCAFNAGNVIRQLGAPVYLFAPVGRGIFADFVRKTLAERSLEALAVETDLDNGSCTCLVEPDGERTMVTSPGIERCFEPSWFDAIDPTRFCSALASGYEIEGAGGDVIISFLEEHPDIQFFYGPGPRIEGVGCRKTARINALKPVWHLNDLEARLYTGCSTVEEAGAVIREQCCNTVIITAGAAGAHCFTEDGRLFVPSSEVEPVDTVGAGDAHLGALVAARSMGHSWEEALSIANSIGRAVCLVSGGSLTDEEFARLDISF